MTNNDDNEKVTSFRRQTGKKCFGIKNNHNTNNTTINNILKIRESKSRIEAEKKTYSRRQR